MKTRWIILVVALFGLSGIAFQNASAEYAYSASFNVRSGSDFYEPLAPFGHWVQVDPYGWCWYPAYVESDWRPYATGYWMWTEDGWYWMSEEPWAWATYHYGRWVWNSYYGWLWTPGVEWAPAWVSWREGGDYVGWAPLPPGCDFGPQRTVIYAEQVVYAPNTFVFVERRHFCEPIRPSILIVNQTIVNKTINITKIQKVNQVVINQGPRVDDIQRVTKRGVPSAQIKDLRADGSSWQRRDTPASQERPSQSRAEQVAQPQSPRRDFNRREYSIDRGNNRSHDVRPVIALSALPLAPQYDPGRPAQGDRFREDRQVRMQSSREVAKGVVVMSPTVSQGLPPVAQATPDTARPDAGRTDRQHGRRDIDDDSPRNGRRN